MLHVERSVLLNYSAEEVFRIVNDIASYPLFVPNCVHSEVHESSESEMLASLSFKALGMTQVLTTRNIISPGRRIDMTFVDGPFSNLTGLWEFIALDEGACKAVCVLSFTPKSHYARFAAKPALNKAANSALDSFNKRITKVYGKR